MTEQELKRIIEAILFAADDPVNLSQLQAVFAEDDGPDADAIKAAIAALQEDYAEHSLELREINSGYRFQVKQDYANWVAKLWEEKPSRYSRAVLETLALIAYRQPITRGEIEEVRGVSVSTQIIKTLQEREWVKVVGHRDVPGKPALYATTHEFLDYFNLKSLQDLPPLAELRDIDSINAELDWGDEGQQDAAADSESEEASTMNDLAGTDSEADVDTDTDTDTEAEAEAEAEVEAEQPAEAALQDEEADTDREADVDSEEETGQEEATRSERVLSAEH
ncbi:SMC-Scp complex subunit ScpB [Thiohalophilus thiocyanatoxydans]|uniref:Condensin subunit ScpB n=1 Tax=Thiohalophilus thiocyanatoxydans TaxID=381308 RepID=A0A4R8INZ8_9GAMM|nr:SMC-Scp complex subunit ScpB [Thiohalophilus thiocyanatoxydans]TDY02632.1 condensin subunit ScpB [Thiohalophilus thiocyanatoxydans]